METPPVPDFVWQALLALAMKFVWPVIALFAAFGFMLFLVWWKKGRLPFSTGGHPRERRANDVLIEKLLVQNDEAMNRFIEAWKETAGVLNGNLMALRGVAGDVQALGGKIDQGSLHSQASFRGVHERLDRIVDTRAA